MNKKVLGTILSLSLAVIITVAAVLPVIAHGNQRDDDKSDSTITNYGSGGSVHIQLPPGIPSHPTTLQIDVYDFDKRSSLGAMNVMLIWLWVPPLNLYAPVALISDSPNPDFYDYFAKTIFNGTPVWTPPAGMTNIFKVADKELEVRKRGDVLTANLTVPISITLPGPLGGSFTLPPTALEFRGFDAAFSEETSLAGLTTTSSINKPAWVRLWIPQWTGAIPTEFVGTLWIHLTRTYNLPPPP